MAQATRRVRVVLAWLSKKEQRDRLGQWAHLHYASQVPRRAPARGEHRAMVRSHGARLLTLKPEGCAPQPAPRVVGGVKEDASTVGPDRRRPEAPRSPGKQVVVCLV